MPTLEVTGARLYYESAGSGPAVVFIHAGIADARMWQPQWDAFASRYQVVRYDTRGYGQTVSEDVPYSNRADLLALLDHLGLAQAALIGCSRGGQIGADFAIEYPGRVAALVLICAGMGGGQGEPKAEEEALFEEAWAAEQAGDWAKVIDLDVRCWVDGFGRPMDAATDARLEPIRALVREMEWASVAHHGEGGQPLILMPPAAGRLGEVRVPALVLSGQYDEWVTQQFAQAYATGITGAQLVTLPTAHLPNLELPDEFNRLVLDFLAEAVGPSSPGPFSLRAKG
jgi:pimeloyl-ACP methyl ester carboxylesterase